MRRVSVGLLKKPVRQLNAIPNKKAERFDIADAVDFVPAAKVVAFEERAAA